MIWQFSPSKNISWKSKRFPFCARFLLQWRVSFISLSLFLPQYITSFSFLIFFRMLLQIVHIKAVHVICWKTSWNTKYSIPDSWFLIAKIYLSFDNNIVSENTGQLKSINVYHGHFYISSSLKSSLMKRLPYPIFSRINAILRWFKH